MTSRHALPLIEPGQAQKELAHNEALTLIDAALHPAVAGAPRDQPPADPAPGACWIVGSMPGGAWSGRAGALACWTSGGWRFVAPHDGMAVWDAATATIIRRTGGAWIAASAVQTPSGGGTVDAEARTAIGGLLATLRKHGLLVS